MDILSDKTAMAAVRKLITLGYSAEAVAAALARSTKAMSVKTFLKTYSGAPVDEEELTEGAVDVEGEVGAAARNLRDARERMERALDDIGFEHG